MSFSSLLSKVFKDDVQCALQLVESKLNKTSLSFGFDVIKPRLNQVIKSYRAQCSKKGMTLKDFIDKRNTEPEEFIWSMVCNVSGDFLESGRYHVYRGALGMTGQELLKLYDYAQDQNAKNNPKRFDKEWVASQKEALRNNIKQIG